MSWGLRKGKRWLFPGQVIGSRAGDRLRRERAHGQAQSLLVNCVPIVPKASELCFAQTWCAGHGGPQRTRLTRLANSMAPVSGSLVCRRVPVAGGGRGVGGGVWRENLPIRPHPQYPGLLVQGRGLGRTPGSRLLEKPRCPLPHGLPGVPRHLTARGLCCKAGPAAWPPQWTPPGNARLSQCARTELLRRSV